VTIAGSTYRVPRATRQGLGQRADVLDPGIDEDREIGILVVEPPHEPDAALVGELDRDHGDVRMEPAQQIARAGSGAGCADRPDAVALEQDLKSVAQGFVFVDQNDIHGSVPSQLEREGRPGHCVDPPVPTCAAEGGRFVGRWLRPRGSGAERLGSAESR